jgi:hypothetical protein
MSELFRYLLPCTYFWRSRLTGKKDFLFHFWYEWLICVLLLAYNYDWNILLAVKNFFLGYFAFISIYELGYLANDIYAVRNEENPRLRIKNFNPSNSTIGIWVIFRLLVFAAIAYYLGVLGNNTWWFFYAGLAVVYYLHNVITNKQLKLATFFQLAFFRFFAPIFIFLKPELWHLVLLPVLIDYVLYRSLTYMDSKGLLNMPDRPLIKFKINYYFLFSFIILFFAAYQQNYFPVIIHAYYLVFWLGLGAVTKDKNATQND